MLDIETQNIESQNNENHIYDYSLKNVKYYKSMYNLIFLYVNELTNIISNKFKLEDLKSEINEEDIKKIIKKIEKLTNELQNLNKDNINSKITNHLRLLKLLFKLYNILKSHIHILDTLDIFDTAQEKKLISETSKNNINKNKLHILDIYKNYSNQLKSNNASIVNECVDIIIKLILENIKSDTLINNINIITSINLYFYKHLELIDFILLFYMAFTKLLHSETIDLLLYNNILVLYDDIKKFVLQYDVEQLNCKANKNFIFHDSFDKILSSKANSNIVKTFNKFKIFKSFNSLDQIFNLYNIPFKSKGSIVDNITKGIATYKDQHKQNILVVIIECIQDDILYNIDNLLSNKSKIDKLSGINQQYIQKTNTIIESSKIDKSESMPDCISNIQKIHIIPKISTTKKNIDYTSYFNYKIILIHNVIDPKAKATKANRYNLMSNGFIDINTNLLELVQFKDIISLIRNQPNYNIENYNILLEHSILSNIENKHILDEYYKKVQFDENSYNIGNTSHIANDIMDDIFKKIKLDFTFENKNIIVDMILNIMSDNISKYIKNQNKLEYDSETYMTYLFSVNSLLAKFKKEIIDNYDNNILNKLHGLINNIYPKILKINDNVIDKYYYTHMN